MPTPGLIVCEASENNVEFVGNVQEFSGRRIMASNVMNIVVTARVSVVVSDKIDIAVCNILIRRHSLGVLMI